MVSAVPAKELTLLVWFFGKNFGIRKIFTLQISETLPNLRFLWLPRDVSSEDADDIELMLRLLDPLRFRFPFSNPLLDSCLEFRDFSLSGLPFVGLVLFRLELFRLSDNSRGVESTLVSIFFTSSFQCFKSESAIDLMILAASEFLRVL